MLHNPVRVAVAPAATTVDSVRQSVIHVEPQKKNSLLVELFADPEMRRTLVFTRTKRGADKVARHLEAAGIKVAAIHGNKSQGQREAALGAFRAGRIRGLVATDIAARGIDIDEVTHVVNFDLPHIPESYVHRIGRTARAGAEGVAISLCGGEERSLLRDIERLTRQSIPSINRCGDAALGTERAERRPGANGSKGQQSAAKRGRSARFRQPRPGEGAGAKRGPHRTRHGAAAIGR
jgi:ATP-dependent RNA helicase RhlE